MDFVISSTSAYELRVIPKTYGIVNKGTGVVELEGSMLPIMQKRMHELEDMYSWTPKDDTEYNEDAILAAITMETKSDV